MEDRLVFPIPPDTHWSDAKPMILPGNKDEGGRMKDEKNMLEKSARRSRSSFIPHPSSLPAKPAPLSGGLRFALPEPTPVSAEARKKPRAKRTKARNDPNLVAAARELRDRWLERVNSGEQPAPQISGKYDLTRQLTEPEGDPARHGRLLAAPATFLPAA